MPNVTRFVQMAVLHERFQIAPQMQFWNVNYARNRRGLSLKCLFMVFIISICEIRMYQLKEEMLQCTNLKMLQCTNLKKSKIALSTKNRLFMPITPFSNQRHPTHFVVEGHIYQFVVPPTRCGNSQNGVLP